MRHATPIKPSAYLLTTPTPSLPPPLLRSGALPQPQPAPQKEAQSHLVVTLAPGPAAPSSDLPTEATSIESSSYRSARMEHEHAWA